MMHQYNKGHGRITQAAPPGASMARNALGASSRTAAEDLICTDDSVAVGRLAHGYELVSKQTTSATHRSLSQKPALNVR
jgi:hypothetical protein